MSNALAIATVTRTLVNLLFTNVAKLDGELGDLAVTAQPLDAARKGVTGTQLNVFLYRVATNAAWRNQDDPRTTRAGETAFPPLALDLHYLVTAYGRGESDNDAVSHRALAAAMSVLHDHSMLGADEIRAALKDNDLVDQIERVRITPESLSTEELSRLWAAFQTGYRITAAYQAAVVLIDSRRPARAALPVLKRGAPDRGVFTFASAAPALDALMMPHTQSAARLGDDIVIRGRQLTTQATVVRFATPRMPDPVDLAPAPGETAGTLKVHLASPLEDVDAPGRWAPGLYTLALRVEQAGMPAVISNELPFALAPSITLGGLTAGAGDLIVNVQCLPRIRDGQRVLLLFGDRAVTPDSVTNPNDVHQPTALAFKVDDVTVGTYTVRLRVDGADSIPVDFNASTPGFDPQQQVAVS